MMFMAMMMVMTISANAMSYNAAKHEALFLSDKMARPTVFVTYKGGHNRVHGSHYAHMHRPAAHHHAPAVHHHAPAPAPHNGKHGVAHNDRHGADRHIAMNNRGGKHGHFSHR